MLCDTYARMSYFTSTYSFVVIILCFLTGGCSQRALQDARETVHQADSLWHAGQMYDDSAALAQTYETLDAWRYFYADDYAHACYHYGKLLRAKEDPVSAMQAFIHATHSRTRDYHILGRVYSNMGSICHLAGDFPLSYDMYQHSAECFMNNNDSLSYYFLLNDMAYELAEQGKKQETSALLNTIPVIDEDLSSLMNLTKAELYMKIGHYDSAIYYAHSARISEICCIEASLILAQSYSFLTIHDSSVYYARYIVEQSNLLSSINNALYILTNDDEIKDIDDLRQKSADRSDTQKLIAIRLGKLKQAVQLLEQDIERKPNLNWLYAIVATLLIVAIVLCIFVNKRRNAQKLLSQQRSEYSRKRQEDLEICCKALHNSTNLKKDLEWGNYDAICNIANARLGGIADKLKSYPSITPGDIRLCILVLLELPYENIADMLNLSVKSIAKLKSITAKKIGVTMKDLRPKLIQIASSEEGN